MSEAACLPARSPPGDKLHKPGVARFLRTRNSKTTKTQSPKSRITCRAPDELTSNGKKPLFKLLARSIRKRMVDGLEGPNQDADGMMVMMPLLTMSMMRMVLRRTMLPQ